VTYDLRARFPVDDRELSALHAAAFGNEVVVAPWAERLARHGVTWVGAFDAERLVGFVHACGDGGAHAFLLDTVVHPSYRRRGIARDLVRTATAEARAAGCEWLHADYEPHLRAFYEDACGFAPTVAGLLRLT
jgi:GNAT superfamily N-acetyltransferase